MTLRQTPAGHVARLLIALAVGLIPIVAPQMAVSGQPRPKTILVAGDIAGCSWRGDSRTAQLIEGLSGLVMTAGDNAYQRGKYGEFRDCYGPTWGRFLNRTRPVLGNHDWATAEARGYFRYFGARAGPEGTGYYAFDRGEWRIYALVSDCSAVGGCGTDDPQYRWLQADLAANPRRCVLAVWHRPRWSSGSHGNSHGAGRLHNLLYAAGADVIVNGHDHIYERFAPARPGGEPDATYGIRQFIVGTGGAPLYPVSAPYAPNSVVRNTSAHGVLRLTLGSGEYDWEFLPVAGETYTDTGSAACHGSPP